MALGIRRSAMENPDGQLYDIYDIYKIYDIYDIYDIYAGRAQITISQST